RLAATATIRWRESNCSGRFSLDTSRLWLAIILSIGLMLLYQELVLKRISPPPSPQSAGSAEVKSTASASPSAATATAPAEAVPAGAGAAGTLAPAAAPGPERMLTIETDQYIARITTHGGRIKSFLLKRYRETASPDSGLYEMIPQTGDFVLPLGAVLARGDQMLNDSALEYTTSSPEQVRIAADEGARVTLEARAADGTTIVKTLNFHGDSYAFSADLSVSGGPPNTAIGLALSQPLSAHQGYYDIPELQADVAGKLMNEAEKALRKGVAPVTGAITYAGFGDRYFLTAYLPSSPSVGTLTMAFSGDQAIARILFPAASAVSTRMYMGPKLLEALEAVNPTLNKSINFGWTGILAIIFLRALKMFHQIAPNYGWDIILLTIALRVLFFPISIRSQRSMMKMQRLQPQMERLRERFKDDQERLQRE